VVAATAATAVALVAVSAIGTDIFGGGQDPLSQSEVNSLLSSSTASAPPTTSTTQEPEGAPTVTEGGTVIARCATSGLVEILSATPAQGYSVDGDDELEDHPSVKFRSADTEIEIRLRCVTGTPEAEISYDD
jgi:hypothetical protein